MGALPHRVTVVCTGDVIEEIKGTCVRVHGEGSPIGKHPRISRIDAGPGTTSRVINAVSI